MEVDHPRQEHQRPEVGRWSTGPRLIAPRAHAGEHAARINVDQAVLLVAGPANSERREDAGSDSERRSGI